MHIGIDLAKEGGDKTAEQIFFKGLRVIINPYICDEWKSVQWYFPISKKKRIRKKFSKKSWCYQQKLFHNVYRMGDELHMSQKIFDKLKPLLGQSHL